MRIAFDGTPLTDRLTGVGYFAAHLLRHLAQEANGDELVLISNRGISAPTVPESVQRWPAGGFPSRMLWMQMLAPRVLRSVRPEVAHFTNSISPLVKVVPTVVTLPDMTLRLLARYHPPRRRIVRILVELSARRADAVITLSQSARNDIVRLLGVPRERVQIIQGAAAPEFGRISDRDRLDKTRRKYGLPERFILSLGTIEPRKNLPRLLGAFARLKRGRRIPHRLVHVGEFGWGYRAMRRRISELGLENDVILAGYLPFNDLPAVYNLCEFFVFPSLYEGFGLPVIEALACGTPVIASTSSSLPEVFGEAAEPVDPEQEESISEAILKLACNPDLRAELSAKGLARTALFSWRTAARQTLEVYRNVDAARNPVNPVNPVR